MNDMLEVLQASSRPMLLLGAGAREAAPDIIAFAECWQIPIETTWAAVDLVPYDHPLFVGRPGIIATRGANTAIQACDLLIAIGARLDQPTIAYDYDKFAPDAKKVMVDVDLSESLKIPNLDRFFHQDAGEFIKDVEKALEPHYFSDWINSDGWFTQCQQWKQNRLEGDTATYRLMDDLSDNLPEDAIIVINSGCMAVNIFCAGFRNKAGQRFIQSSCGLGSMGAAIPVAIGVALASGKTVYCIDGDGSFMQNVQELEVVRRLNLPIVFFVMDNRGYASIRSSEMRAFGRSKGRESIPDIKSVAESFGIPADDYPGYRNCTFVDWSLPRVYVVQCPDNELPIPRVMFDGRGSLSEMWPYE